MKSTTIFDSTRDECGNFQAGYRASVGSKYVTIKYLTNWEGDRDKRWRLTIADYGKAIGGSDREKILYVAGNIEPDWEGQEIR